MISRTASGAKTLGSFGGLYRYGEANGSGGNYGPRQLTSVRPMGNPMGTSLATYDYDGAGRQIRQNGQTLTYNGFDQLTDVDGVGPSGTGTVQHDYGFEGFRVRNTNVAGATQLWFSPNTTEKDGTRDHYIRLGARIIARVNVEQPPTDPLAAMGIGGQSSSGCSVVPIEPHRLRTAARWVDNLARGAVLGPLFLLALVTGRLSNRRHPYPRRGLRILGNAASLLAVLVLVSGCQLPFLSGSSQPVFVPNEVLYFHNGIGPGPMLITRDDSVASIFAERRYGPFGEEVDAYVEPTGGGTGVISDVDFSREAQNSLNQQSDPDTGWSYHGARWMAPETARWLTPDPPVKAPDPKFMASPWSLHPYQYVEQNPIVYWDPNGHYPIKTSWWDDATSWVLHVNNKYHIADKAERVGKVSAGFLVAAGGCASTAGFGCYAAVTYGADLASEGISGKPGIVSTASRSLGMDPALVHAGIQGAFTGAALANGIKALGSLGSILGTPKPIAEVTDIVPWNQLEASLEAARGAGRGWRIGDDVYATTARGNAPSWSTVRSRFWKNEAAAESAAQRYGAENLDRMRRGLAPQRFNPQKGGMESMELSHEPIPARQGGRDFVPRWPEDHARVDPYRRPGY